MRRTSTRDSILSEARELFLQGGVDRLTMRAVAGRVGVTPMAIYRHFDGYDQLLEEVIDRGHATFLGYLQRALGEPTPAARLLRAGQEYLNFALEQPRDYHAMFMEPTPVAKRGRKPRRRDTATFRFLVDRLRECADADVLDLDDPEPAALTAWAHVHGLVSLHLAGRLHLDEPAFRKFYDGSLADLFRGLGWRGRSRRSAVGGRQ